jgi:hypothetical protein
VQNSAREFSHGVNFRLSKRKKMPSRIFYVIPKCLQIVETVVVDVVIFKAFKVDSDSDLLSISLSGTAKT